jgi:hypothetical protein
MGSDTAGSRASGAQRRALRAIAAFEAIKGAVALAASLGFLGLLHHDPHRLAASLIGHIGLDPGAHYPAIVLRDVDQLLGANLRSLVLAVSGYVRARSGPGKVRLGRMAGACPCAVRPLKCGTWHQRSSRPLSMAATSRWWAFSRQLAPAPHFPVA